MIIALSIYLQKKQLVKQITWFEVFGKPAIEIA